MKHYRQSFWIREPMVDRIVHIKAGYHEELEPFDKESVDSSISGQDIPALVEFLIKEGFVRPLINNESRKDDVNIINKLIDVLDKHATKV